MNCENCQQEHDGTYGSGRFCSVKCARGFSTKAKRKDINEKVSKTLTRVVRNPCEKCGITIPHKVIVDGIVKNLEYRRKYCIECYPSHKSEARKAIKLSYKCKVCGETDPSKFYGCKRKECGKCRTEDNVRRGKEKRRKIVKYLGSKCVECGYNRFIQSLDVHHKNPNKKDKNFSSIRGWSWDRIIKELEDCVLLCRNCHSEFHGGFITGEKWSE